MLTKSTHVLPIATRFPVNETFGDQSLRSAVPHRSRSLERTFRTPPPTLMSLNPRPPSRTLASLFSRPRSSFTAYSKHSQAPLQQRNCHNCGSSHPPYSCPAYGLPSSLCFRLNHVAKCCRSSRRYPAEQLRPTLPYSQGGPFKDKPVFSRRRNHHVSSQLPSQLSSSNVHFAGSSPS